MPGSWARSSGPRGRGGRGEDGAGEPVERGASASGSEARAAAAASRDGSGHGVPPDEVDSGPGRAVPGGAGSGARRNTGGGRRPGPREQAQTVRVRTEYRMATTVGKRPAGVERIYRRPFACRAWWASQRARSRSRASLPRSHFSAPRGRGRARAPRTWSAVPVAGDEGDDRAAVSPRMTTKAAMIGSRSRDRGRAPAHAAARRPRDRAPAGSPRIVRHGVQYPPRHAGGAPGQAPDMQ